MTEQMHTAPDRRTRLSRATETLHQALDQAVQQGGYFSAMPRYVVYLQASLQARRALEAGLQAAALLPREAYEIAPALEADLRDLGAVMPPALPPAVLSSAEGWGTLYVLQGSSMGALHMRKWAGALGLSATHGARHLDLQAGRASTWRGFVAQLNEVAFLPEDDAACLAGARGAFSLFADCFAAWDASA